MNIYGSAWTRDVDPDILFNADGSVKLPKMTGIAIDLAARSNGLLTRQPHLDRAEAVRDAVRDRVEHRGYDMEIRQSRSGQTFGLYLVHRELVDA